MTAPDWFDQAMCRNKPTRMFYGASTQAAARALCAVCPVRADCLDHAIATREPEGIWGGMDAVERDRERRRRQRINRRAGNPARPNPQRMILDHLGLFGPWRGTVTALADELGLSRQSASVHVNRLADAGRVYIDRHGIYPADPARIRALAVEHERATR